MKNLPAFSCFAYFITPAATRQSKNAEPKRAKVPPKYGKTAQMLGVSVVNTHSLQQRTLF